ncbi:MAG: hypothetical protein OHK0048_01830 [Rhodoferax sp.]
MPVGIMGLLALLTYWLVRSAPGVPAAYPLRVPPPSGPDFEMTQVAVKSYDAQGLLKSELRGARARHYPTPGLLEIESVVVHAFEAKGRLLVASAATAQTDDRGERVALSGSARLARTEPNRAPALGLVASHIDIDLKTQRVYAGRPVTLTRGGDRFTAERLDYDYAARSVVLSGRVRGVIQAR